MKLRKLKKLMMRLLLLVTFLGTIVPNQLVSAAIKEVTVDEEEYNLSVQDMPSFTSEWTSLFAKMNSNSNPEDYTLSLFDDVESTEAMMAGLEKAGKKVNLDNVYGMQTTLYKINADDGEYYPVEKSINITVICPVPDYWLEAPDKVQTYMLTSAGKAQALTASLISVNEVPCLKFTVASTGVYGFVYSGTPIESSEEAVEDTPITEPEVTVTSIPKETPTATPKGSNKQIVTKTSDSEEVEEISTPLANINVKQASNSKKLDHTPKTGDDAPIITWLLTTAISGSAIVAIVIYLKRK